MITEKKTVITERELLGRASIFMANCGALGHKVSFGDCLKVILLSTILDSGKEFSTGELELILRLVQNKKKSWYKLW